MKYYNTIIAVVCLMLCSYLLVDKFTGQRTHKIGIIQMDKLVYDYVGMKDASKKYSDQMKRWTEESDSLEQNLKMIYNKIKIDSIQNDKTQLQKDVRTFVMYKRNYEQFVETHEERARKQDSEMTTGVLNQLSEYIKNYAQKKGYDVILTNTQQQSVGYAKDQIDVTQEILEFANNKYEGF